MRRRQSSSFMFFPLLILFNLSAAAASSIDSDVRALLAFRSASDSAGRLSSWNLTSRSADPCYSWLGLSCSSGRVTRLVLENLSLSATSHSFFPSLLLLDQLRVLSLKSNSFYGPLPPDLSKLRAVKLLFLSHNSFSGPIPPSLSSLSRLYRLDLSFNNLSGPIPNSLNSFSHLLTLRLQCNSLSGSISGISFHTLKDLNFSYNHLSGAIPPSLASFPAEAFVSNLALCGAPLPSCSNVVSEPSHPNNTSPATIISSPTSKPEASPPFENLHNSNTASSRSGMSRAAVVAIVVGDFVVLVLVSCLLFCYFWRKFAGKNPSRLHEGEKIVYSSSPYAAGVAAAGAAVSTGVFERGKMVFFDETKKFELEELLRASAEMLGKGGYGTAYKAILDDGGVVAVKRLRDVQLAGKRDFEQHMELLGRLRHPNLVTLKAYYFARDEKLLVYDFMPGGSLYSLLHGNRGPGRTPLDWGDRMRIAMAAARGLSFVHQFAKSPKLAHGNVKSTNILLDKSGTARLADVGLALLGKAPDRRFCGYRPPEASLDGRRPFSSQRADVYAFGVVLLEILTGKPAADGGGGGSAAAGVDLPRWVQSVVREEWTAEVFDLELMRYRGIEEEMVAMLQIALACTVVSPDLRPKIGHVVRMIEEVHGGGGGGVEVVASPSLESSESDSASDDPTAAVSAAAAGVGH
ncbi:hypothetical protein KFK09_017524 [Dendrobium nobile]|uniref:Protein kinase domain-containing protein n=1 Tax=Dendrobium nobile TaxID=94219 RepID=A0A8T3B2J1_DENNO|nr:hypothetical protein KFK09_017524 [Dendrobium nobile]